MAKNVYEPRAVWDFMERNSDKILEFKITNVKQIAFGEWDGATYWVNVKIVTLNDYKNKLITMELNSHWWEFYADPEDENESLETTIERFLETSLMTYS
ncbi:hypothetical protein EFL81_10215 [Weissella confusa]|uniref:hypothetical protein n=1 Tax=Weissella confusa TaxID=1583 RepID=UPI00223C06E1|nr:hypothetical protein [Weissella confusa]MCS9997179.1 hypothetical protein [Weissella confusa]